VARPELVQIPPQPLERYRDLLGDEFPLFEAVAERAREEFAGRAIWHVNSTARGGGVAEILHSLLPYVRGVGVDTRWAVLHEEPEFFAFTKRLHNHLHEDPGDGGPMGEEERRLYESALQASAAQLSQLIQPRDVVYLHDPQTAGLVTAVKEIGVKVVWRCHIGVDHPGELARGGWDFLRPYVEAADACVFSRKQYVWEGLDLGKVWLMPPSIDPFAPKNQELDRQTVEAVLGEIGLAAEAPGGAPSFVRGDGTPGRVERRAELLQEQPLPGNARLAIQVSRWDRLKDPRGLLEGFAEFIDDPDVHLALVGPASRAVADDPEGAVVYGDVAESWRRLPDEKRGRAHLVSLPMDDIDENAAMVNAIQRRADVIVQKSIAEGFGLTVAEAMWKGKPVVASRLGGIQDQIDGDCGLLVDDPHDLEGFAAAITRLLADPALAERMGRAAKQRVRERFLAVGRLREYVDLVASLIDGTLGKAT
jgi:trehalose synthase